jgi:hypothetical protein
MCHLRVTREDAETDLGIEDPIVKPSKSRHKSMHTVELAVAFGFLSNACAFLKPQFIGITPRKIWRADFYPFLRRNFSLLEKNYWEPYANLI